MKRLTGNILNCRHLINFKNSLFTKQTSILNKHNLFITPQMHFVIQEIINCNRVGKFKRMLIEAKVIELLMLQLEQRLASIIVKLFVRLKKQTLRKCMPLKKLF
jgi:hypothetical protein